MYSIYTVLYWLFLLHSTECHYVDPFDMLGYNHAAKSQELSENEITECVQVAEIQPCNSVEERNFIRRFIYLIIENSGITTEDMQNGGTPSLLQVKIDTIKLKYLQSLLKSQNFSLQELDQTISSIIFPYKTQQSFLDNFMDISWPSQEVWLNIFMLLTAIVPIVGVFYVKNLTKIIICTLLVFFGASYYINYHKFLKEAEINQYISSAKETVYCSDDGQSLVWNIFNLWSSRDDSCTKHLHTANIDPKYRVNPLSVAAYTFSEPFLHFMENFGLYLSKFSNIIFSQLSWLHGPFVYICGLFMIFYIVFGVIAIMFRQDTKLFGIQTFQRNLDAPRNEDILQRPMIEELLSIPKGARKEASTKGDSFEEVSDILNCEQFKCNSCQKLVNYTSDSNVQVQNSNELQTSHITEINKDTLQEAKK